jgi:hypothetical protein
MTTRHPWRPISDIDLSHFEPTAAPVWLAFPGGSVLLGYVRPDGDVTLIERPLSFEDPTHFAPLERPRHPRETK